MNLKIKFSFILLILIVISCKKSTENEHLNETKNSRLSRIQNYKAGVDSLNKSLNWTKTNFGLWRSKNGDLGLQTTEGTDEGIFINKYITELTDGRSIKKVIDTTTFKYLGSSFYQDKNHIYTHFFMIDGGNFQIVKNADTNSFKILGDCYAKDKSRIFTERNMNTDTIFDYRSFKTCDNCGCYAKDKNGFYFWDEKIDLNNIEYVETKDIIKKLKKL
ncbi:DKNYY domain-containing protein [Elizabethkingia anophelis]|uniref:DKNYY domain-containing protein n=1 Tax=Elizabethkingia anophelis TaxID=1117645 RepID=UPI00077E674F|nr:DKNYY domain-containing protein [Elizabethkingia anophelis]AMR40055.1 hypothetical protein A2T74_01215 [Elizabethkingia anophelis]AMX46690.1 hypothetical protein A4C56_01215 [Elizabethkingia anophelis]AMX50152.1 hypothetical protein A2T72_01215 [Elizabethkingia anophelis]AMX53541.1 hypothetical protein A2T59_01215 [Elizabethkingia anophelis]EGT4347561.1 hypothetical protein [Elizabethkingia anophelis]